MDDRAIYVLMARIALRILAAKLDNEPLKMADDLIRLVQAANRAHQQEKGKPIDPERIRQHDLL